MLSFFDATSASAANTKSSSAAPSPKIQTILLLPGLFH